MRGHRRWLVRWLVPLFALGLAGSVAGLSLALGEARQDAERQIAQAVATRLDAHVEAQLDVVAELADRFARWEVLPRAALVDALRSVAARHRDLRQLVVADRTGRILAGWDTSQTLGHESVPPGAMDPVLLRRVLDNLISNAIAHSPGNGRIDVVVRLRAEGVELSVEDEGPGVPGEHRERIFDKYAQLEARRMGVSSNRGLGLTFCRLAIEAHGGTIWVEDAPRGGARFIALLPAAVGAALPAEAPAGRAG